MTVTPTKHYAPAGAVIEAFHASNDFVRMIRGPVGSGKTTACVVELIRRAFAQEPGPDGKRRTRWAAIRNTYGELRTTTIKSWNMWMPETVGSFSWNPPPTHRIQVGDVDLEIMFLALDRAEDVRRLYSLELTGAFLNEARELPKAVLDTLTGRVGRFPPMQDGGPAWSGIICDGMPPDTDHWWYKLAEETRPAGYAFFSQPGGFEPDAENIEHLPPEYYQRASAGKDDDWRKVYIDGQYGFAFDGKAVWPEYRDSVHCAKEAFPPIEGLEIQIGVDFGLSPAAIFTQRTATGQWRWIAELTADDMGAVRFAENINALISEWFEGFQFSGWGDPAGAARAETDERTALQILTKETGIEFRPAPSNSFVLRREAVAAGLNRMIDGQPGLLISPACRVARKGLAGGYVFKRVSVGGHEDRFRDVPDKNLYSHVCDAGMYVMLGGGEGRSILGKERRRKRTASRPTKANSRYNPLRWRVRA